MIKIQRNLKATKSLNKKKKLRHLVSHCLKLSEDDQVLTQDGVESIYNVYLKHHPIKMNIQNGPNTMDHNLTTSFNHRFEPMW